MTNSIPKVLLTLVFSRRKMIKPLADDIFPIRDIYTIDHAPRRKRAFDRPSVQWPPNTNRIPSPAVVLPVLCTPAANKDEN